MKFWILGLILALLLTGCADPNQNPTEPEPTTSTPTTAPSQDPPPSQTTPPTEPKPIIDESAPVNEMALEGGYDALATFGDNLLIFRGDTLSRWAFGHSSATATVTISGLPLPGNKLRILDSHIVYFDSASNGLIYLNENLGEHKRLQLKETILGDPYLTTDGSKLYFCSSAGLRVWDTATGICQNLTLQDGNWLGITGALLGEDALRCQLQQPDETIRSLLISTKTGQVIWEGDELNAITGNSQLYCYPTEKEWIFGIYNQQPQVLQVPDAIPLIQRNGALTITKTETGLTLDLYSLIIGRRIAALELPGVSEISGITATEQHLYFYADGKLLRWTPRLTFVDDDTRYTSYRYTADDPDTEGLAAFQAKAQELSDRYGIQILMWNDVAKAEPAGYTFGIAYQTAVYEAGFAALEKALSQFPDNLPDRAADWLPDGTLHIVLVESITTPSETAYQTLSGMEYLLDGKIYIVLELGDQLEQSFYHALFHVIDPLVLSNSIAYYKWNDLNPAGFEYDNDYIKNLDRDGSKYLDGTRYFIDTYSMSYGVEDRARIFEYAIMPGNEAYFSSKPMQKKLKMLCSGLREVFELGDDRYIWEQYLNK